MPSGSPPVLGVIATLVGWGRLETFGLRLRFFVRQPTRKLVAGLVGQCQRSHERWPMSRGLNAAAGSLLGDRDRVKAQHHVAIDTEMEAIEPPDCAAAVKIGECPNALYCGCDARYWVHDTSHLETRPSRDQCSKFCEFLSVTVRCRAPASAKDWELRFMFAMDSTLDENTYVSDLSVTLRCKYCFPKHPDLVVPIDSTLMR